jgi:hypothetical protein
MAVRVKTINQIYNQRQEILPLDGILGEVLGNPEKGGAWIIYGSEKQGKTWLSVKMADYLSEYLKVLYISAEEGLGPNFVNTCQRANLHPGNRMLQFTEYISLEELRDKLDKRRSAQAVFLDNVTIYADELKGGGVRNLLQRYPNKLFIFIAHEDRNEPYTAQARLIRKLAKVVVYVKGLYCNFGGRVPGGALMIDEERAMLYHAMELNN